MAGDTPSANSSQTQTDRTTKGQWQTLGVDPLLAKSLTLRGFKIPTPIQRATLPHSLAQPPQDVLGMARTGSGKTLAYLIPLIQRLRSAKARQSSARALIMVPTRELALQVLRAGKDVSRGIKVDSAEGKRSIRWAMIIGGDPLDKQFELMTEQPDIVIATPGRFLHVVVEMKQSLLDMSTVVYDEADRLFELGFQVQLQEILARLPSSRHSMLFSATLPSSVAEFVRAGLQNPAIVRLDADVKINPDLTSHFVRVNSQDKEAALILLLDLIDIPTSLTSEANAQAIVFVATKHHVEYVMSLLVTARYSVSHVYGSLDQIARQRQLQAFRDRRTSILVVTDVAARGLDIPIMDHVINFDFPPNPRVFVHRVGRTARGGRKGSAWSILDKDDLPYFADLAQHLQTTSTRPDLFALPQSAIESAAESVAALTTSNPDLQDLRGVMRKGDSMYKRSRSKASAVGYRTVREWQGQSLTILPALDKAGRYSEDVSRDELLNKLKSFRPAQTGISVVPKQSNKSRNGSAAVGDERADVSGPGGNVTHTDEPRPTKIFRDEGFYMEHAMKDDGNRMYSLAEPNTQEALASSILDLQGDEQLQQRTQRASQLRWDRKTKRFRKGEDRDDKRGPMIKTESGSLLPATFDSGRFKEWQKQKTSRTSSRGTANDGALPSLSSIHRARKLKSNHAQKSGGLPARKRKA